MSRAIRKQLFSIVDILEKANDILEKLLLQEAVDSSLALLTECQNCAIEIGTQIEKVYGEELESIRSLEEYCEFIYQLAESLKTTEEMQPKYEKVCRQVQSIKETMQRDIPDKQEIVFFPYKASMWDSLESVYLKAREDENCDVYVVPIPYFDRKSDGTLGEMHCEADEYPANIEVTSWEDYDFEVRRPDVVYIHNAYDEYNLVTCVHPKFFSTNLKKFTERLVYIPYFVLEEIEPDDQEKIDKMKHFCFLPGIVNADQVILQSEKMRQIYMNEYRKVLEESGKTITEEYLEKKFLGTGSPKFDKVLNTKREDVEIPEEWRKIIEKPDGSRKQVIFYNTSIGALLKHGERMLKKMKNVFNVFIEWKEEVALLWRPHPLIQTTIESMRPQLWIEYAKIVKQYRQEGWGIYDDTADLDRAVVLCDAYYGDHSSVIQLCQKVRKPVLLQSCWMYQQSMGFSLRSGFYYDQKIWCMNLGTNELFAIDTETATIDYVETFEKESKIKRSFSCATQYGKQLFLLPWGSTYVGQYHLQEKKANYFKIREQAESRYMTNVLYQNSLFAFPFMGYGKVLKLDLQSGKVRDIELGGLEENTCFLPNRIIWEEHVILACNNCNKLLLFDMDTEQSTWIALPIAGTRFVDFVTVGEIFYLLDEKKCIYKTNMEMVLKGEIETITTLKEDYSAMVCVGGQLVLVPCEGKVSLLNLQDMQQEYLEYPKGQIEPFRMAEGAALSFFNIAQNENKVFLLSALNDELVVVDTDKKQLSMKKCCLSESLYLRQQQKMELQIDKEQVLDETEYSLDLFLQEVKRRTK